MKLSERRWKRVERIFDLTLTGELSLDLANTIDWRSSESPLELLGSYADLLRWGRHTGILKEREARELAREAASHPEKAVAVLKRVVALRETLFRIFSAVVEGEQTGAADLDFLNRSLAEALARLKLRQEGKRYEWEWKGGGADLERIVWPVIRSASEFLTSNELSRLRLCQGEGCAWLFVDTSRNKRRRWCTMEICGNRSKARRHYEKKGIRDEG